MRAQPAPQAPGARRRPRRRALPQAVATGLLAVSAVVGMTGCTASAEPEPSPTESSARPTPSPTAPAPAATLDPDRAMDLDQELPETDLDLQSQQSYTGPPRTIADVHHLPCLEALAGDLEIPEQEGEPDQDLTPWSVAETAPVPDGWKLCKPGTFSSFLVPEMFTVEQDEESGDRTYLKIWDADEKFLGGLKEVGAGSPARQVDLLRVVDIQRAPSSPAHGGETAYLRTLVVQTRSGPQLLVDLVSAPFGEDPESLDVWDLAVSDRGHRALVWAAVPLASPEDADRVIGSRMHEVLQQMVGSFRPAVQ